MPFFEYQSSKSLTEEYLRALCGGFTSTKGVVVVTALFFPAALLYPLGTSI